MTLTDFGWVLAKVAGPSLLGLLFCAGGSNAYGAHCFCTLTVGGQYSASTSYGGYIQTLPNEKNRCKQACQNWLTNDISQSDVVGWAQKTGTANPYSCVSVVLSSHVGTQSNQTVAASTVRVGNPCPYGGSFDGANCLVASPPSGASAFIWEGNFYYPFVSSNPATQCPLGNSDSANCFLGPTPEDAVPFLFQNRYYYSATCNAGVEWISKGALAFGAGFLAVDIKATKYRATATGKSVSVKVVGKGPNKDNVKFPYITITPGNRHVFAGLKSGRQYCLEDVNGLQAHCYKLP